MFPGCGAIAPGTVVGIMLCKRPVELQQLSPVLLWRVWLCITGGEAEGEEKGVRPLALASLK